MASTKIINFSNSEVNKAGKILSKKNPGQIEYTWALDILNKWRTYHAYPINTFQATLRTKLKEFPDGPIVAQRLKRAPTIIDKLRRFPNMQLARMQDIGGIRAIVNSIANVRGLEKVYKKSRFNHELQSSKDYIGAPKKSGYRGVHLVYKYKNPRAPQYDGLLIELQIRTRLQHTWATTVETMGTLLGDALKSSQGDKKWLKFLALTSAAFAKIEKTAAVPGFEDMTKKDIFEAVVKAEKELGALHKMAGFVAAADLIQKKGTGWYYHLIILNSIERKYRINSFPKDKLPLAAKAYAKAEKRIARGEKIDAVLVSAGPLKSLHRAYPNYFLDTKDFVQVVKNQILSKVK